MVRLIFPRHMVGLIARVQYALGQAKQQGFNIQNIMLDVGSVECVTLHGSRSLVIGCDLFPQPDTSAAFAYYLQYISQHLVSNVQCMVNIGLPHTDSMRCDSWQQPNCAVQSLIYLPKSSPSEPILSSEQHQHFAWVVAMLALDFPLEDALCIARAALSQGQAVSRETWPTQLACFPQVGSTLQVSCSDAFPAIVKDKFTLYPVVDTVEWIEFLLKLGVKTLQLRIKDPHQVDLEEQIIRAIALGREHDAQLFINDYWQLAIKHQAYGVHLGQEDLTCANLPQLLAAGVRLGLSTHGYVELLRAAQIQPSYIALGHIFPTTTKQMPSKPQGLVRLSAYQRMADQLAYHDELGVPTVAIGGIDGSNICDVLACGVNAAAVVRAITQANDPVNAVQDLQAVFVMREQGQSYLPTQLKHTSELEVANAHG